MAPLNILTVPNRILTRTARRIERSDAHGLPELYARMVETMSGNGVGLAAPQVGKSLRFFVALDPQTHEVRAYVNPRIVAVSDEMDTAAEGCLSIPGVHAYVERHLAIVMRFQDLDFAEREEEVVGWYARILQHEHDHLNGVLISDRAVDGLHVDKRDEETEEVSDANDAHSEPMEAE